MFLELVGIIAVSYLFLRTMHLIPAGLAQFRTAFWDGFLRGYTDRGPDATA
jgi:hypothetical protein